MVRHTTRREALAAVSGTALLGVAGCTGGSGGGTGSGGEDTDGNSGGNGQGEESITLATAYEPGHVQNRAANNFKEIVEEETDGSFTVEVVPGGSYGDVAEIAELVASGGVEAHSSASMPYNLYAPEYMFVDMAFIAQDFDHLVRIMESDVLEEGHQQIREEGNQFPVGDPMYRGTRHFTSNTPVQHPDDVQDMKLRLPEYEAWVDVWSAIGASPTPVALDELYSALETGVAEASEGDVGQMESFNLFEVQSHASLTGHVISQGNIWINDGYYEDLDEAYQDVVSAAASEATTSAGEWYQDQESEIIDTLADEGMEIVEDVDKEAFAEAGRPALEELFESEWVSSFDEIQNM